MHIGRLQGGSVLEKFEVEVRVYLKEGLLDPQGRAIEEGLKKLGLTGVSKTRAGKLIKFEIEAISENEVKEHLNRVSNFLRNPVIEDLDFKIREL